MNNSCISNFEKYVIEFPICNIICEYLNLNDIYNILYLNKDIHNNKLYKKHLYNLIKNRSSILITKIFKKYISNVNILKNNNLEFLFTSKYFLAFHFMKNYPKNHIDSWINFAIAIINHSSMINVNKRTKLYVKKKYKHRNINSRIDLYFLIKNMSIETIMKIGW
jgi:hypothetical protein